jgi:hypothetical protein
MRNDPKTLRHLIREMSSSPSSPLTEPVTFKMKGPMIEVDMNSREEVWQGVQGARPAAWHDGRLLYNRDEMNSFLNVLEGIYKQIALDLPPTIFPPIRSHDTTPTLRAGFYEAWQEHARIIASAEQVVEVAGLLVASNSFEDWSASGAWRFKRHVAPVRLIHDVHDPRDDGVNFFEKSRIDLALRLSGIEGVAKHEGRLVNEGAYFVHDTELAGSLTSVKRSTSNRILDGINDEIPLMLREIRSLMAGVK